jgi:hypothetical protein
MEKGNETRADMAVCKKCFTPCDRGAKFCSSCGNSLSSGEAPNPSRDGMDETQKEKRDGISLNIDGSSEVKKQSLQSGPSPDEDVVGSLSRLICPKCKILYERGSSCIRCRSPLVERGASVEREELKPPETPGVNEVKPLLVQAPGFKEEEEKTSPKQEVQGEVLKPQSPQRQHAPNRLQGGVERKGSLRKRKIDRILHLSFETGKILILVGAAGYLLWSISTHLFLKRPEAGTPTSKGGNNLVLPHSSVAPNPPTSVTEPQEIRDKQKAENPSMSKEVAVTVSQPSSPTPSASGVTEMQELEGIRTLLENVRQGNLLKNIELFMACYSPSFKDREGKKRETLKTWGDFNYRDLSYDLRNCSISGSIAHARVAWRISFFPKTGGPAQEDQTVLEVRFERREDGWKILEVKSLG